jgi:hypothetical protein
MVVIAIIGIGLCILVLNDIKEENLPNYYEPLPVYTA